MTIQAPGDIEAMVRCDMLPTANAGGFSGYARPSGPRWRLTGLPGPTNVLRRVLIAVKHQSTGRTDVGADRQALGDPLQTAAPVG
jgi:hypothetical protein